MFKAKPKPVVSSKLAEASHVNLRPFDGVTFPPPAIPGKKALNFHVRITEDAGLSYRDVCAAIAKLAQSGDMVLHDEYGNVLYWGNISASSITPKW